MEGERALAELILTGWPEPLRLGVRHSVSERCRLPQSLRDLRRFMRQWLHSGHIEDRILDRVVRVMRGAEFLGLSSRSESPGGTGPHHRAGCFGVPTPEIFRMPESSG